MKKANKIILIMTDTQRVDMLGCYGNSGLKTPSLDRLASEGVRFNRAYTCQPVCGPARAALFTGLYPHSNASWANSMPLDQLTRTIGQRMSAHGYHTAYVGKWHVDGGDYFGCGDCPDGWDPDYWYDMRCYLQELSDQDRVKSRKSSTNEEGISEEFTFGHRCSNRAIDFLEKYSNEDFFLVVSYDEPHDPCLCPKEYIEMYKDYEFPRSRNHWDTLEDKPEHHRVWAGKMRTGNRDEVKIKRERYFGCNTFVDYEIGRVLKSIDKHAPDALVIYTSDHGDGLQSHCIGGKGPCVYEEIVRAPFIVRWPGVAPAGAVSDQLVSHIDIVPSLLEAAGMRRPKLLQGHSMLKTIKDPSVATNAEVFIEFSRYEIDHDAFGGFQPMRAIVTDRYKLAINLLSSDELYDLQEDPDEMINLIDSEKYVGIRNKLHGQILDWMNDTRDPFRGYYWERRPWRTDAREATWAYTAMTRQRKPDEGEKRQLDYKTGLEMVSAVRNK